MNCTDWNDNTFGCSRSLFLRLQSVYLCNYHSMFGCRASVVVSKCFFAFNKLKVYCRAKESLGCHGRSFAVAPLLPVSGSFTCGSLSCAKLEWCLYKSSQALISKVFMQTLQQSSFASFEERLGVHARASKVVDDHLLWHGHMLDVLWYVSKVCPHWLHSLLNWGCFSCMCYSFTRKLAFICSWGALVKPIFSLVNQELR